MGFKLPSLGVPKDRLNFIFLIFLLNGIGTLLPWNMLINADNYFVNYKLNVTNPSEAVTNYRTHFLSYLGIASKAPNILLQIANMLIGAERANLSRRISITLVIQIAVFLLIIGMATMDTSHAPDAFFWATMGCAAAINLANGVYQGCIYGLAGRFPMAYTNGVTMGMNGSGTLASLLMILSIAVSPSAQVEAIVFFSMAVVLLAACLVAEFFATKSTFYRFYANFSTSSISAAHLEDSVVGGGENTPPLSPGCQQCFKESGISSLSEFTDKSSSTVVVCTHLHASIISKPSYNGEKRLRTRSINSGGSSKCSENSIEELRRSPLKKYLYIFKRIWVQLLNIILIYTVSLSIFPALNARILSTDNLLSERYFAPVFCFLFFNLFATVGNGIAQYFPVIKAKYLIIFSVLRIGFIPFFLYCNYLPSDTLPRTAPVIFTHDWMYIVGAVAMAVSSGYLSSLVMMYIPKCVHAELSATAGMFAALTIILGILVGINISLIYPTLVL